MNTWHAQRHRTIQCSHDRIDGSHFASNLLIGNLLSHMVFIKKMCNKQIVSASVLAALLLGTAATSTARAQMSTAYVQLPDAPGAYTQIALASVDGNTAASHDGVSSSAEPAQETAQPDLKPQQKTDVIGAPLPAVHTDPQPKRILGIIPNFRTVTAGTKLPPQTVKDKLVTASQDTFDYSALTFSALVALEAYGTNATPEFGTGGAGYGRYLWHTVVDQSIENYFVEFIIPAVDHEDTRFYTLGHGGFLKRSGYALGHVVVTRNDSGKTVVNAGEILGAGAAAGISNLYYPSAERTLSNTGQKWGVNVGLDAMTFVFKEFWPDINHKLFHQKY